MSRYYQDPTHTHTCRNRDDDESYNGGEYELCCPECECPVDVEPPASPKHNTVYRCPQCGRGMRRSSCASLPVNNITE